MMQAAETAGITAMADALVASGSVSREQASQMLAAEIAAAGGNASDQPDGAPTAAFGAQPAATAGAAQRGATPASAATPGNPGKDARIRAGKHADAGNAPADAAAAAAPYADPAANPAQPSPANPLAEIEIDPLFAPPDNPDGYHLTLNPKVPMTVADVQAVREWFHTLRLPQPIAQSLYSEVERMSQHRPDAAAIDRMNTQTLASLRRAWGERTDTMLGHARRLIDDAAQVHPGIKAALKQGPGSHPVVVRQLAEHAARLYERPGARPQSRSQLQSQSQSQSQLHPHPQPRAARAGATPGEL